MGLALDIVARDNPKLLPPLQSANIKDIRHCTTVYTVLRASNSGLPTREARTLQTGLLSPVRRQFGLIREKLTTVK